MTKKHQPGQGIDNNKLDRIVADARQQAEKREQGYREQSLRIHPWICARCGREFTRVNLRELTVHHKDHNHDNNPQDGSNWENLCLYCHDNEHQRYVDRVRGYDGLTQNETKPSTHNPFAALGAMLKKNPDTP
ncbi:MAG: YajD family HNH nuclease [Gammaproteobacteria bacterium SHHR-1]|uniref:YajD family HNH nuclease n=1 Tax=Magnetovirga frankeli TaxID=947516 RepID=UPI001293DEA9|nr:HNH nuclease family protein [gamma proteobacterium SS-5]